MSMQSVFVLHVLRNIEIGVFRKLASVHCLRSAFRVFGSAVLANICENIASGDVAFVT